jgi:hypothetical protein
LTAPKANSGRFFTRTLVGIGAASVLGLFLGGHRARARQTPEDGSPE